MSDDDAPAKSTTRILANAFGGEYRITAELDHEAQAWSSRPRVLHNLGNAALFNRGGVMRYIGQWIRLLVAAGIVAAPSLHAQPTKVTMRLDWKPGGQYSPFYYGKEKGFYSSEGIDLQIIPGSGSSDSVKQLAVRAIDIALFDALVLVQAAEQRVPVKAVAAYYQRTPIVLMSPKAKPVTDVKQLLGDIKLGTPKGSAVNQGLIAMLFANNIKLEQVKIVDIGFGVQPLLVKQVDAIMAYTNVQPPQAEGAGMPVHELFVSDFGVNAYGSIIGANHDFMAKQPAAIAAFLRATRRAVVAIPEDRQNAAQSVANAVPEIDVKHELKVLERTVGLWPVKAGEFSTFGQQTEERWQQTIEVARRVGLVEKPPAVNDVFVGTFIK